VTSRPFVRVIRELSDRQTHLIATITEPAPLPWTESSPRAAEPRSPRRILAALVLAITVLGIAGFAYGWLLK